MKALTAQQAHTAMQNVPHNTLSMAYRSRNFVFCFVASLKFSMSVRSTRVIHTLFELHLFHKIVDTSWKFLMKYPHISSMVNIIQLSTRLQSLIGVFCLLTVIFEWSTKDENENIHRKRTFQAVYSFQNCRNT